VEQRLNTEQNVPFSEGVLELERENEDLKSMILRLEQERSMILDVNDMLLYKINEKERQRPVV
jgi:hypothetical protein